MSIAWVRRRDVWIFALAGLVLAAMFGLNDNWDKDPAAPRGDGTYRPILARGDGHVMYLMTMSLADDGDLVIDDQLAKFGDPFRFPRTPLGFKVVPFSIGPTLVWLPLYWTGHGVAKVLSATGADVPEHGYTMLHQRLAFASSVVLALLAAALGAWLAARTSGRGALSAALAVLFGTTLTYYATFMPSYSHALDAAVCAAFLVYWAFTRDDVRWRRFAILGALLGLAMLVRVTGAALAVVLVAEALRDLVRQRGRTLPQWLLRALAVAAVAGVVFAPQMLVWKSVFGEYLTSPMGADFVRLAHPQWLETLFSSRNGWLSSHPLAYAGVVGLFFVPREHRFLAGCLFLVVAVQLYVNACVWDWWSGSSFGQRRMASVTVVLVVGFAALLARAGQALERRPWVARALAALALGAPVAWNLAEVYALRAGKAANASVRATCCDGLPAPVAAVAQPAYDLVGNPLALPASAVFAMRFGVPLKQWDVAVGKYVDHPTLADLASGAARQREYKLDVGGDGATPFVATGLGRPTNHEGSRSRVTTAERGTLILNVFQPGRREVVLEVAPAGEPESLRVEVGGDGTEATLRRGWQEIRFEADLGTGSHALELHSSERVALRAIRLRFPR